VYSALKSGTANNPKFAISKYELTPKKAILYLLV
jgi:hypothetical protein